VSDCIEGWPEFPKGLCSREGNAGNGFFLVISIARWNHMHIGRAPWNNKSVIVC